MWQQVLWPWQVKTARKKSNNMKFWVGPASFLFKDRIWRSLQSLFVLQLQLQQIPIKSNKKWWQVKTKLIVPGKCVYVSLYFNLEQKVCRWVSNDKICQSTISSVFKEQLKASLKFYQLSQSMILLQDNTKFLTVLIRQFDANTPTLKNPIFISNPSPVENFHEGKKNQFFIGFWDACFTNLCKLGPVQTSNFTCAKSNANEKNLLFSLICIRFGTC